MVDKDMFTEKNIDETEVIPTEEATLDETELEAEEEFCASKIKTLRTKLAETEEARAKLHEDLQRARADFLNSKRRLDEQSIRNNERVTEEMLIDLLPLVDSFEKAMSDKEALEALDSKWKSGMQGIHALLVNFLKSHGVTEIETSGKHFNPHEHEAISNVPVTNHAQVDTVIEVLQKGFKRNDTVLRPAKVTVGIESH